MDEERFRALRAIKRAKAGQRGRKWTAQRLAWLLHTDPTVSRVAVAQWLEAGTAETGDLVLEAVRSGKTRKTIRKFWPSEAT